MRERRCGGKFGDRPTFSKRFSGLSVFCKGLSSVLKPPFAPVYRARQVVADNGRSLGGMPHQIAARFKSLAVSSLGSIPCLRAALVIQLWAISNFPALDEDNGSCA